MNRPLQEFLIYLDEELRYSPETINAYKYDCELFLDFLFKNNILFDAVTKDDVLDFTRHEIKLKHSKKTCARRRASLCKFYWFLAKKGYIKETPFKNIGQFKVNKTAVDYLTRTQVLEIIYKNSLRENEIKIRDGAIIALLYATGIRCSELVNLTINDINFKNHCIRVFGKGRKHRNVPYSIPCAKLMDEYNDYLRPKLLGDNVYFEDKFFINANGEPLSARGVEYIFKQLDKELGLGWDIHPHMLRHTFATTMFENGANLKIIQELLGHTNVRTTEHYTHISRKIMKDAVEDFKSIDELDKKDMF